MLKALLVALLEPTGTLRDAERKQDYTSRLVMFEELKSLPWAAVWDSYCERQGVPVGMDWYGDVRRYEKDVLSLRQGAGSAVAV